MLTIDDFVMLGTTVPEPNSDGRVFVCSAGVSPQLKSLVRIYPLARFGAPRRWTVNEVRLERNPKDSRRESWKLAGDRSTPAHRHINDTFTAKGSTSLSARAELLRPYVVGSIAEANERRLSLAVLDADALELEFEHNPTSPNSPELTLFDVGVRPEQGARRFPFIPRLRFRDAAGPHRLMLRDWGTYELMRKHRDLVGLSDVERRRYVGDALHLDPSCSLLVGNLNNQRTAWLVISVLRGIRADPGLFADWETAS